MNNRLPKLKLGILFLILLANVQIYACGFDFVGSCATVMRLNANSVSKDYFVSTCAYGNIFGSSIGTRLTSLQLSYASTVSWESCTNQLKESALYYRVFNDPQNKGSFIKGNLSQESLLNNPPYRTRTRSNNFNIDLLAGLLPNTIYTMEVYFEIKIDTDGNGTADDMKRNDNAGAYYAASFQTGNIVVNSGFPINILTENVACNGGANGTAIATASGGTAPYTYAWSTNQTGSSVSGLSAGSYTVTATDATGAFGIKSFTITEPLALSVMANATNPTCLQTNGAISLTLSGGTPAYTISWSNGATAMSVSNLAAGSYSVTVTDSRNCTATSISILTENCGGNGAYCTSTSSAPWSEWIARVQFNTLDNASSKIRQDRYAVGYSDWKDKATVVQQGATHPLSITPELSWSGAQTNLYYRAWIDFNGDGVFDANEKVLERNAVSLAVNSPVTVPLTAKIGTTVLRVSMKTGAYPTACESFAAGEVEDYTIVITAGTGGVCATETTPPVLSACPANISLTTTTTCAIATWTAPTATDNCTPNPSVIGSQSSGFCFPIGTTAVTYTATDARNNTATCSFNVEFSNPCAADNTPPVLSACPINISLTTITACATATWTAPTATDNCTTTPSVSGSRTSGFCFLIGSNTVTYTATDARNNTATCSFSVVVSADVCAMDNIPPVLTACPANISLTTNATCIAATWTAPTATDNCTTTPSVSASRASGFCFPVGTNTVTYTATDARNNTATCNFNVEVSAGGCTTDNTPPILSACPQNISLTTTTTCATATWTAPTASDNCTTTPSVSGSRASGFCFPIGSNTVTYTATDAQSNTATCSFTVVVSTVPTGGTDLGLTIASSSPTFSKWSVIRFKITAKNNGTTAFSNIQIQFKFPVGTVNGGNATPSVGTWQEWCNGGIQCFTWTIPSLAANVMATLDAPVFVLNVDTPMLATTRLLSSVPTDSQTANNTATTTVNPLGSGNAPTSRFSMKPNQYLPLVIQQIAPNPTDGDVTIYLVSLKEQVVQFDFYNSIGHKMKTEKRAIEKGDNHVRFDFWQMPQSVYFIQTDVGTGRDMPLKFVKL